MRSYWIWFLCHVTAWSLGLLYFILSEPAQSLIELTWSLLGIAIYFMLFFMTPLFIKQPKILMLLFSTNIIVSTIALFPEQTGLFNPYILLILALLLAESAYRLPLMLNYPIGLISVICLAIFVYHAPLTPPLLMAITLYMILLFLALLLYKKTKERTEELQASYDALLSEYRSLKRRLLSDEELARQEERSLIGHEIHDSVGHKLTALLMQLEMFRLQGAPSNQAQVKALKELAQESLDETRNAVKALKKSGSVGLSGVMRLIRKLEIESFIRIHFSVRHGALAAPLTGEQSFVVYRSVQEALTNIMRHSQAREAQIMFEAPGGRLFRFEISNPITNNTIYQEGFGLSSMRDRLEKHGGSLEIHHTEKQFTVIASLKIEDWRDNDDSRALSRGPNNG